MMMDQKSKTHKKLKIVVIGIILILVILYIILVNVLVSAALVPSFMKNLMHLKRLQKRDIQSRFT